MFIKLSETSMPSSTLISTLAPLIKFIPEVAIGRLIPNVAKWFICLLFLLNIRSWPLIWHFRVFKPVFALRFQHHRVSIRSIFKPSSVRLKIEDKWFDSLAPVGANPFEVVVSYKSWASFDECDFNCHLSNSSYAKTLDVARFRMSLATFPLFLRAGGWTPLAATHYHFIREIPMLSSYEVRTSIAAWDRKWIYVLSKFVSKSDGKKKRTTTKPTEEVASAPIMALRTSSAETISSSPTPSLQTISPEDPNSLLDTENALKVVSASLVGEEPDRATLHTIAVSQLCFKVGRITVPPAIVIALNGLTGVPGHSHANPPPEWAHAKRIMSSPLGGSPKKLKEFLVGGWKDIPESERWWDKSLGENVEAQRVKNISMVEGLRKGLEMARAL